MDGIVGVASVVGRLSSTADWCCLTPPRRPPHEPADRPLGHDDEH
jgi:hypothetical protein